MNHLHTLVLIASHLIPLLKDKTTKWEQKRALEESLTLLGNLSKKQQQRLDQILTLVIRLRSAEEAVKGASHQKSTAFLDWEHSKYGHRLEAAKEEKADLEEVLSKRLQEFMDL